MKAAAVATGIANEEQIAILWPQLKDNQDFLYGGMPTGIASIFTMGLM